MKAVDLVEGFLQVRRSHALGQVPVSRVRQEELPLGSQRRTDVLLPVDVLLTAVHHPDVACGGARTRVTLRALSTVYAL